LAARRSRLANDDRARAPCAARGRVVSLEDIDLRSEHDERRVNLARRSPSVTLVIHDWDEIGAAIAGWYRAL